jgi:hypothetical protein
VFCDEKCTAEFTLICSLFYDVSSYPVASNGWLITDNELEGVWKAAVLPKVRYYPGISGTWWLRNCATSRKVAGSIPGWVIGIFH